ncbi:MAG: hypothetical protein HC834_04140, partial [Rhodospirillales bacterium]|nr:hypothetical protein [Rhodospirillales bacterium]
MGEYLTRDKKNLVASSFVLWRIEDPERFIQSLRHEGNAKKLVEGVPGFGSQRAQDLYTLGEYIVRASIAPVIGADNIRSGYVCLLQDMTAEVAVDRAKTNFIGTISHELKTPLTVISGNS